MVASLTALGREAGDSQARVSDSQARVLWPCALVMEPSTATCSVPLPAARQELPVVSVWRWVCASVSG